MKNDNNNSGISGGERLGSASNFDRDTFLSSILATTSEAIISINEDQQIVLFNPGAEQTFGYTEDEVLGKSIEVLIPPSFRTKHADHIHNFAKEAVTSRLMNERLDISGHRKNGETFPAEASITKTEVDGRIILTVILRDITERVQVEAVLQEARKKESAGQLTARKRLEEKLLISDALLRDAIECIPGGFALFDSEDKFILFNSKFSFDKPPVVFRPEIGMTFEEFIREREKLGIQSLQVAGKKLSIEERLERHRNPAGPMETPSQDGQILQTEEFKTSNGGTGIIRLDITSIKKAVEESEAALRQAQKMEAVGQLTGGVAHDFNNLLAVILGNVELLEDEFGDSSLINQIDRAASRGAELTQRLLAFSRQQTLQAQSIELTELVADMDGLFQRTLGEPIKVVTNIPEDIWPAMADPGQLENALLNIAINSRDAMPGGGILEILCSNIELQKNDTRFKGKIAAGDYVQIAIRDTGDGMSKAGLERAFEPFYTTKEVGEGSGLGLSMVYGFAQQSGGDAVIESIRGKGTVVRIFLPRAMVAAGATAQAHDGSLKRGQGEVILVLEDDGDVRELAVTILERLGYQVLEAGDANAAMRIVEEEADMLDLLLCDVVLPGGISGPEFAARVKDSYPDLKPVFMSGYAADLFSNGEMAEIGEVLLAKPFKRAELATVIHDALAT